jgi:hypothetical protein
MSFTAGDIVGMLIGVVSVIAIYAGPRVSTNQTVGQIHGALKRTPPRNRSVYRSAQVAFAALICVWVWILYHS